MYATDDVIRGAVYVGITAGSSLKFPERAASRRAEAGQGNAIATSPTLGFLATGCGFSLSFWKIKCLSVFTK